MLRVRAAILGGGRQSRSDLLCRRLERRIDLRPTALVAYEPIGGEVDPRDFVDRVARRGVPIYYPRYDDRRGEFVCPDNGMLLVDADSRVVILVPGVAFDHRGARLGRGGGWYDQVLSRHPRATRVGCAFDEQLVDHIPCDPWDVSMHKVVTDARSIAVDETAKPLRECAHERT